MSVKYVIEQLTEASNEFNSLKRKYPTMKTTDVIALLDRAVIELQKALTQKKGEEK